MHRTVRQQMGVLLLLLCGCSPVDNDPSPAPAKTSQVGGAFAKAGATGEGASTIVDSIGARGGTTSTVPALGGTNAAGGNSNATEPTGNGGTTGVTTDPPPGGGKAGADSVGVLVQGGAVSTGGAAALPTAGAAGSSARPTETLTQLIGRFCALKDVLFCTADCAATRKAEAAYYTKCWELYRQLMACQIELLPSQRVCKTGSVPTVTSPDYCTNEDIAYWACVGLPRP